jgi:hypothetical protein
MRLMTFELAMPPEVMERELDRIKDTMSLLSVAMETNSLIVAESVNSKNGKSMLTLCVKIPDGSGVVPIAWLPTREEVTDYLPPNGLAREEDFDESAKGNMDA